MEGKNLSIILLIIGASICSFYNETAQILLYQNDILTIGIVSASLFLVLTFISFRLTINIFDLAFLLLIVYKACRITVPFDFSNTNLFIYFLTILLYLSGKIIFREQKQQISYLFYLSLFGGLIAFTGFLNVYDIINGSEINFIHGTFPSQGQYAGMLALLFPFPFLALKYSNSKIQAIILWTCVAFLITISALTICRSLWASILVVAWLFIAGTKRRNKGFYLLSIVGMIAIAIILFKINKASVLGRLNIWTTSLQLFADHPLLGIGTGRFAEFYPDYQAATYANGGNNDNLFNATIRFDPYNEYLRGLVEGGAIYLIGLLLVTVSIFTLLKKQDKTYISSPFLYPLISLGVYSLFYYPFDSITTIILSTLICSALSCTFNNSLFELDRSNSVSLLKIIFITLLSGIIYTSIENFRNATAWYNAQINTNLNPEKSLAIFTSLNKSFNSKADFLMDYGHCLYLNGETGKALVVLEKAVKLKPSTQNLTYIGTIYKQASNYKLAIQAYEKAADLTPYLFRPKEKLFDLYINKGDSVNAADIAKKIINQPVKVQSPTVDSIKLKATKYLMNMKTFNYNLHE